MRRLSLVLALFLLAPAFSLLSLKMSFDKAIYMPGEVGRVDVLITSPSDMPVFIQYRVNGEQFILNARELRAGENELSLYFQAPSREGFYDFEVEVRGDGLRDSKLGHFVVSPPTKGFLVDLKPDVLAVRKNGTLRLRIANVGSYDDVFEVLFPKYLSETNYSYVEVPRGGIVELNLSFDSDGLREGSYDYELRVCSLSLWKCEEVHSQIIVKREEGEESELEFPELLSGMPGSVTQWKVKIRNKSNFNKTYALILEPLNFLGTFENVKIGEVPPGEGEVSVDICPNETGDFSFSYKILSNGVEIGEGVLNLSVRAPFPASAFLLFRGSGWTYFILSVLLMGLVAFFLTRRRATYPYAR